MKARETRLISWCYWIVTLLVFVVLSLVILMRPAHAGGGCETDPAPKNNYLIGSHSERVGQGVLLGAVAVCAAMSIYNQRWCWETEPPAASGDGRVTPDNLSDRSQPGPNP
jgi:hypothetical protein